MRGLEEIKKINEDPHGFHGDSNEREQYGNAPSSRTDEAPSRSRHDALQKILEEITGGKPKAAADRTTRILDSLISGKPLSFETNLDIVTMLNKATGDDMSTKIAEMAAVATVFDKLGIPSPDNYDDAKLIATALAATVVRGLTKTLASRSRLNDKGDRAEFLGMDGIHSAIDVKPDFLAFWQKLNDDRAAGGRPEARYQEAKLAFSGGETPKGALTFIGKEWDGLRAVPSKPYEGRKSYHGEFSTIAPEGNTVWNVVSNTDSSPISYANAEAALSGARHARIHAKQAALEAARSAIS